MYADKLSLLKIDDLQTNLDLLNSNLISKDSIISHNISDIATCLSDINASILAENQDKFFGVSWDVLMPALITAMVSLIVFSLSNYFNNRRKRRSKQEKRQVVKDTIITWAEKNIPILKDYITSLKELGEMIEKSDDIQPQAFHNYHLTVDVLSQFTIDRLTDSLYRGIDDIENTKGDKLHYYLYCVSYLIKINKEVEKAYDDYSSQCYQNLSQWNKEWRAFTQDVSLNYDRSINLPDGSEKTYYLGLVNLIKSGMTSQKPISFYHELMLKIIDYNNNFEGHTASIINTNYKGSEVFFNYIYRYEYQKTWSNIC